MMPTLPNEVNAQIVLLIRRGVRNTPSSRLRKLLILQSKQRKLLKLILPQQS
jgi:hypothetical protein